LRASPNYPDAFDSRGLVDLKLGFYKKAIADFTSALSQLRGTKRASSLYGRGIAKRRIGNAAGAKADIDVAKILKPAIVDEFASYGIQ
jgi:tetratricopeptide (TPR) repeat protein